MIRHLNFLKHASVMLALAGVVFTSCEQTNPAPEPEPEVNYVGFVANDAEIANLYEYNVAVSAAGVEGSDLVLSVQVKSDMPAEGDISVLASFNKSQVASFNEANGTDYSEMPDGLAEFVNNSVTIKNGQNVSSETVQVNIPASAIQNQAPGQYLLPVVISDVTGDAKIADAGNVAWMLVTVVAGELPETFVSLEKEEIVLNARTLPSSAVFTAKSENLLYADATVTVGDDMSLVDSYNTANGTSYVAFPEGSGIEISVSEAVIKAGESRSAEFEVALNSIEGLEPGVTYIMPVAITAVSEGLKINDSRNVVYVLATMPEAAPKGVSLDLSDYNMYANHYFEESQYAALSQFTYQFRVKARDLNDTKIHRPLAFNGTDNTIMFRFGEGGVGSRLQMCAGSAGNHFLNYTFETETWYQITVSYDGTTFRVYVDGSLDMEQTYTGYTTTFYGVELGMSWAGYRESQAFNGCLSEMRIWNKALTADEINTSLETVDPESDSLMAYWKLDEGEGYIFNDATGNGYDIDWSDTYRCVTESEPNPGTKMTDTQDYVRWEVIEE